MKCIGLTKQSNYRKRCQQPTKFFFCWKHKWQPFLFVISVITVLAALAQATGYNLRGLFITGKTNSLKLGVAGAELEERESCEVLFGLPKWDHTVCIQLPLIVNNTMPETAHNVSILFKFQNTSLLPLPDNIPTKIEKLGDGHYERVVESIGNVHTCTIKIGNINPGRKIIVLEPLLWSEDYISPLPRSVSPIYVTATVSAEDCDAMTHDLLLRPVVATSFYQITSAYSKLIGDTEADRIAGVFSPIVLAVSEDLIIYMISEGTIGVKYGEIIEKMGNKLVEQ